MKKNNIQFAFFGTSNFSVIILDELEKNDLIPSVIVTAPDKPTGRKQEITPSLVAQWAKGRKIETLKPNKLDENFIEKLKSLNCDLYVVASYGKIIPKSVLDIPKHESLNVHPSLLPKLRGASPMQNAILEEEITGVTIMKIDEEMDHGPIILQEITKTTKWPIGFKELERIQGKQGGRMLSEIIPDWIAGNIDEQEQDHKLATFTKKITKQDGLIDLKDNPQKNYRKIKAYEEWPGTYFLNKKDGREIRVLIKEAELQNGELVIKKVLPEGRKEMDYKNFLENFK